MSRVWNKVYRRLAIAVTLQLELVRRAEVSLVRLLLNGVEARLRAPDAFGQDLVIAIRHLVGRLCVEARIFVLWDSDFMMTFLHTNRLAADLFHLVLSVTRLIARCSAERQIVNRVLRVAFVIDILVPVSPIDKAVLVLARGDHGSVAQLCFPNNRVSSSALLSIVDFLLRCPQVHTVWIYDLCFLFQVERLFVRFRETFLLPVFLFVKRGRLGWVRIADEPIKTPSLAAVHVIAHWDLLKWSEEALRALLPFLGFRLYHTRLNHLTI